jgi:hypothetical protein
MKDLTWLVKDFYTMENNTTLVNMKGDYLAHITQEGYWQRGAFGHPFESKEAFLNTYVTWVAEQRLSVPFTDVDITYLQERAMKLGCFVMRREDSLRFVRPLTSFDSNELEVIKFPHGFLFRKGPHVVEATPLLPLGLNALYPTSEVGVVNEWPSCWEVVTHLPDAKSKETLKLFLQLCQTKGLTPPLIERLDNSHYFLNWGLHEGVFEVEIEPQGYVEWIYSGPHTLQNLEYQDYDLVVQDPDFEKALDKVLKRNL